MVDVSGTSGNWVTNVGTRYPIGNATHSGSNVAYFNSFSAPSGNSARLYRTTGLDLSGIGSAQLSFWMFHDTGYSSSGDNVQLQISTDGGTNWYNVGPAIYRYDGLFGWKQHTIDISSYTGTGMNDVMIGFLGVIAFGNDCHIDDVTVTSGTFTSEPNGIYVNGASNVIISENTINGFNARNGIRLDLGSYNTITQNTITNC